MTLRQLIKRGVDLDDEILIKTFVYDENGDYITSYCNEDEINIDDVDYNIDSFMIKVKVVDTND